MPGLNFSFRTQQRGRRLVDSYTVGRGRPKSAKLVGEMM